VSVHAGAAGQIVFLREIDRIFPVNEFELDGLAVGVIANGAFARVALEVSGALRFGSSCG
jgi:hypothetical protein